MLSQHAPWFFTGHMNNYITKKHFRKNKNTTPWFIMVPFLLVSTLSIWVILTVYTLIIFTTARYTVPIDYDIHENGITIVSMLTLLGATVWNGFVWRENMGLLWLCHNGVRKEQIETLPLFQRSSQENKLTKQIKTIPEEVLSLRDTIVVFRHFKDLDDTITNQAIRSRFKEEVCTAALSWCWQNIRAGRGLFNGALTTPPAPTAEPEVPAPETPQPETDAQRSDGMETDPTARQQGPLPDNERNEMSPEAPRPTTSAQEPEGMETDLPEQDEDDASDVQPPPETDD
jgi:hypothetical protein